MNHYLLTRHTNCFYASTPPLLSKAHTTNLPSAVRATFSRSSVRIIFFSLLICNSKYL